MPESIDAGRKARGRRRGLLAALLLCTACAKSDAAYLSELTDPDPFTRTLAALALCKQAPEHAPRTLEVLLEGVDRVELALASEVRAALDAIAPRVAEDLIRSLLGDPFMTHERREAVRGALIAAGPACVPALLAAARGMGPERVDELRLVLIDIGPDAAPYLGAVAEDDPDPELAAWAADTLAEIARLGARSGPHPGRDAR